MQERNTTYIIHQIEVPVKTFLWHIVYNSWIFLCKLWLQGTSTQAWDVFGDVSHACNTCGRDGISIKLNTTLKCKKFFKHKN